MAKPREPKAPRKPPGPRACTWRDPKTGGKCSVPLDSHRPCIACGGSLDHGHDAEFVALEWEGLARSAMSKRDVTGEPLTAVEREALHRCPYPRFLDGATLTYQARPVRLFGHGAA